MKKLIYAFILAVTANSYAEDCRVHLKPYDGLSVDNYSAIQKLTRKISKRMKKSEVIVVKNANDANIGLEIAYYVIDKTPTFVNNGPYKRQQVTGHNLGVALVEWRDGRDVEYRQYPTLDVAKITNQLLKDINCSGN